MHAKRKPLNKQIIRDLENNIPAHVCLALLGLNKILLVLWHLWYLFPQKSKVLGEDKEDHLPIIINEES